MVTGLKKSCDWDIQTLKFQKYLFASSQPRPATAIQKLLERGKTGSKRIRFMLKSGDRNFCHCSSFHSYGPRHTLFDDVRSCGGSR